MYCDDSRLAWLLTADEAGSEYETVAAHIDECPRCQQRLLELSGEQDLLAEFRETLRTSADSERYHGSVESSVLISIESTADDSGGGECEPISLDFLGQPTHPEMLGRIGRYDVERMIGSGGMGIVLKGFDTELHRVVAIKVLKPHLATNGAARRRFAREAQSAAAVVHEHVIPIHDVQCEGNTPFLVMQYVPGQSLQARVDERGPLEPREVLRIGRQVAAGLAAAHAQGLVHRDVKPANILLEQSVERVLISDFGLARTSDDATLTRTGIVAGTPHYMSPEQASGRPIDHRSDLFSLGSLMYFMCTGRSPFRADHAMSILNRICHDQHRPVDEVNPDVPAEVADTIDRLLQKDPADRFSNATQVVEQLEAILIRLQNGQRSRRLRWRRSWLRWQSTVKRSIQALMMAAACVAVGAALTWWIFRVGQPIDRNAGADRTQTSVSDSEEQSPSEEATAPSSSEIQSSTSRRNRFLTQEEFTRELGSAGGVLSDIELRWSRTPQSASSPDEWHRGIDQLDIDIKILERALLNADFPVQSLPDRRLERIKR